MLAILFDSASIGDLALLFVLFIGMQRHLRDMKNDPCAQEQDPIVGDLTRPLKRSRTNNEPPLSQEVFTIVETTLRRLIEEATTQAVSRVVSQYITSQQRQCANYAPHMGAEASRPNQRKPDPA